jgi:HEAT repeat protein
VAPGVDDALCAPPGVERFVRQLIVASKSVALYPPGSRIPEEAATLAARLLDDALVGLSEIRIIVDKGRLFFADSAPLPEQPAFASFALQAYRHHLASVTFRQGADTRGLIAFLSLLAGDPEDIRADGGFAAGLWSQNVVSISVAETEVMLVEAEVFSARVSEELTESVAEKPDAPSSSHEETVLEDATAIDAALVHAIAGRVRERRAIAHLIGDPATVREYLETVYRAVPEEDDLEEVAKRFSELAQIASQSGGVDRELSRQLSEVLAGLDPELRRRLLAEKVLREGRTSEAMADIVRHLGADEILRILAEAPADSGFSERDMLTAVRDLAAVTGHERADLATRAGVAMRDAGVSDSLVDTVVDLLAPSRLIIRGGDVSDDTGPAADRQRPADVIARIMETDAGRGESESPTEEIAALTQEARRGITDGDVISTLVLLATLDVREEPFASTMGLLEDSLLVLIGRGDIELASETAFLLRAVASRPGLSPEQRRRLERAVERFARPEDVRSLADALRLHMPGSAEHRAARNLLETLGPLALPTLLEHLADESSMSARRGLVELISGVAGACVHELAQCIGDPRWYFVRNVVSILGATRSQEALPLLERTLRHSDVRVRRETVRALSSVGGPSATRALLASLADEDASVVQLAVRCLGVSGAAEAIGGLEAVARGEGAGSRENGPRLEALEMLGRVGTVQSIAAIEHLAGRRALLGLAKTRDLRAAAESAIAAISAREGGATL